MEFGNSIGPFLDRIPATPETFAFVEPSLGELNVPLREFDPETVRATCAEADLDLVVHLPIEQPLVHAPPEHADGAHAYFERALDLAVEAGADRAVAHCTAARGSRDDVDLFRQNVRRLDAAGRERGVEVTFENLGKLDRGYDLETVGRVLDDCDAACCFDVGHAFEEDGQGAAESFVDAYADIVTHLHVHDVRARGDTHLALGDGEVDYDPVVAELAAAGFDGTVTIEAFSPDLDLCARSADRLRDAFDRA